MKVKSLKKACVLLSFVVLASCVSAKYKPSADAMEHFEEGKTTYHEVVGVLGKPLTTTVNSNGDKIIVYSDMTTKVDPATYIPIVGLFAGGAKSNMKTLSFTFKNDVLKDMQYSESSSHYKILGN